MPSHSPIIFWLLLAVTLCVDAVAFSWGKESLPSSLADLAYFALLSGQLSVICVWAALRPKPAFWTRLVPLAAVVAAAFGYRPFGAELAELLAYFGLHAAALLACLWVFRRTAFWQRKSGAKSVWRFSVAHLLILTTVVALLIVVSRESTLFEYDTGWIISLLAGSVVLSLACVAIWSVGLHWLLKLSGACFMAIILGVTVYWTGERFLPPYMTAHYLIQAAVIAIWLTQREILPLNHAFEEANTDETGASSPQQA